jgi:small subunit ribosomal protein S2
MAIGRKKTEVKKGINMQEVSLLDMLKAGVHFGHQKQRWHPKMKPYIYTTRAGVHIIDLEQTAAKLSAACDFITATVKTGGTVLFVATKRQAQSIVKTVADEVHMPSITNHWIGGTLTNFDTIHKLISRLKDLRSKRERGELAKYTKLEQLQFSKEITDLEKSVGGIEKMSTLPQALFIVDLKTEKTALREARKKKIPIVAIVDTNCNPDLVDYPIPANDDATKSLQFLMRIITATIKTAQQAPALPPPANKEQETQ